MTGNGQARDQTERIGYVTIGTTDLAAAVDFYTRMVRLTVTEARDDAVFLTGGTEHCWLRLEPAETSGALRVAYKVADLPTLDRLTVRVEQSGTKVERGGSFAVDRIDGWARFADPSGQEIELYTEMLSHPFPPEGTGVAWDRLLHAVWQTTDPVSTSAWYEQVLGFLPSDTIDEAAVFLRCGDRYHHSLALLAGPSAFHHLCLQVATLDDVMRLRQHMLRHGIELRSDVLRHAPSGSIGIYVEDRQHGLAVEFCWGHGPVPDDHRPRRLPLQLDTFDVWQTPLPEPPPVHRG
jgi:catechol-2,3-dioxygenase